MSEVRKNYILQNDPSKVFTRIKSQPEFILFCYHQLFDGGGVFRIKTDVIDSTGQYGDVIMFYGMKGYRHQLVEEFAKNLRLNDSLS